MHLQRGLWRISRRFANYNLAACFKGEFELQRYRVGMPLPPQMPLSEAGRAEVKSIVADLEAQ